MLTEEVIRLSKEKTTLTDEQLRKLIGDLTLGNPETNILALYALAKDKSSALADDLFKKWLKDLVAAMKISGNDISGVDSKTILENITGLKSLIDDLSRRIETPDVRRLKEFVGYTDSYSGKSIHDRLAAIETNMSQIAADVFNSGKRRGDEQDPASYVLSGGRQTYDISIVDMLAKLFSVHGGDNGPTHNNVNEEVIMSYNRAPIRIGHGEFGYIFPSDDTKHTSHTEQTSMYISGRPGTITNMVLMVSSNSLDKATRVSVFVNGVEAKKKTSIMPGAQGVIDASGLGIPVKMGDRVSIKISSESATTGNIDIDTSALVIIKGPFKE